MTVPTIPPTGQPPARVEPRSGRSWTRAAFLAPVAMAADTADTPDAADAAAPSVEDVQPPAASWHDLYEREQLLGDVFGVRSTLAEHGVGVKLSLTQFYMGLAAGERQKNTELNQQLHVLEQTLKG